MKENVSGMESNMEHLLDTVIFTLPHLWPDSVQIFSSLFNTKTFAPCVSLL
jgi:hypothetical protein